MPSNATPGIGSGTNVSPSMPRWSFAMLSNVRFSEPWMPIAAACKPWYIARIQFAAPAIDSASDANGPALYQTSRSPF